MYQPVKISFGPQKVDVWIKMRGQFYLFRHVIYVDVVI